MVINGPAALAPAFSTLRWRCGRGLGRSVHPAGHAARASARVGVPPERALLVRILSSSSMDRACRLAARVFLYAGRCPRAPTE